MKYVIQTVLIIFILSTGFLIVGCSSSENSDLASNQDKSEELYTCGMHPNVIQEGPGNCPICGMNLTPLNSPTDSNNTDNANDTASNGEKEILYYRAPMDPTYISPKPGKSPMGMDLIPVYAGEESFGSTIKINPSIVQNIGVRTAKVITKDLSRDLRTVGRVDYDETQVGFVQTKYSGWVENIYVDKTGQVVNKGDVLLEIYSPQLVTAQEEYLETFMRLKQAESESREAAIINLKTNLNATRKRLENFDISNDQIDRLEKDQLIRRTLKVHSPFSGIVDAKHVQDGMEVKPGMKLYSISSVSSVWVYADVYEYESPWVKEGQRATMSLSYIPGKEFSGYVDYVYPYLDKKTRTLKVRLTFSNKDGFLKPGMYANVNISSVQIRNAVAVPVESVLFSGERNLVFIALEGGRFAPREITVGIESGDGFYEVIKGLNEGEVVVTSSQFLLDSESKLQESIAKMLSSKITDDYGSDIETTKMDEIKEPTANPPINSKEELMNEHNHDHHSMSSSEMNKSDDNKFGIVSDGTLTYYTCPMESHSYVKMNEPGKCPDCGMFLTKKEIDYNPDKKYYTCPMDSHSYVVMENEGNCPVCNMKLVEL